MHARGAVSFASLQVNRGGQRAGMGKAGLCLNAPAAPPASWACGGKRLGVIYATEPAAARQRLAWQEPSKSESTTSTPSEKWTITRLPTRSWSGCASG